MHDWSFLYISNVGALLVHIDVMGRGWFNCQGHYGSACWGCYANFYFSRYHCIFIRIAKTESRLLEKSVTLGETVDSSMWSK